MAKFSKLNGLYVCDKQAREDLEKFKEDTNTTLNTKETIKDSLVVFGDSWTAPNVADAIWSTNLATALNLTLHNYAVDGAGFVLDTHSLISDQISTFINDVNVDKTKVKYIVLMGGINDFRYDKTYSEVATAIINCINTLKIACSGAKILYVSNCEYPYTRDQSWYWKNVHNELNQNVIADTYSLDCTLRRGFYNFDNYYHLSQEGQKYVATNILKCLTGGVPYNTRDPRTISNDDISVDYSTIKISNDCTAIKLKITPKVAKTSYSVSITDDTLPDIPYGGDFNLNGSVGTGFNSFVLNSSGRNITIASSSALVVGKTYELDILIVW